MVQNSPKAPKLKPKYQLYADSILRCSTQRQAALDAGIKLNLADKQANRMSQNDKVVEYLDYHRAILAQRNNVTLEDVVPTLRKIRDDNKAKRPHIAVSACAELAKIGNLYSAGDDAGDSRPAFTGIIINMGNGTVAMQSVNSKTTPDELNKHKKTF